MGVIEKGMITNEDGSISFGNYETTEKVKIDQYMVGEDEYKLRSYNQVTRLSKNNVLIFESVPGVTVHNFKFTKNNIEFSLEGNKDVQLTLELEPLTTYKIILNGKLVDEQEANAISGKINFSLELADGTGNVTIEKTK